MDELMARWMRECPDFSDEALASLLSRGSGLLAAADEWRQTENRLMCLAARMNQTSGGKVTLAEFCAEAGVSGSFVQRKFGGWKRLREHCGLPPACLKGRGQVHSRDSLFEKLLEIEPALGPPLTEREFCERAKVSTSTIERHWGSWRALRAAAGRKKRPRRYKDISQVHLSVDLHCVVQRLGRFPSMPEIDQHGEFGSAVHLKRWKTPLGVREHYERFVKWMNQRLEKMKSEGREVG